MSQAFFKNSHHFILLALLLFIFVIIFFIKSNYSILISSSILILGLFYFLLEPAFKTFRNSNGSFVDTIIAVVATLFGVYVALFVTNKQTDKDNRELIIKLSGAVQSELKVHSLNFKNGEVLILAKYKNDDAGFISFQDSVKRKGYQLVPEFKSCDLLLNNDLFLKYVNKEILINLLSMDKMLKKNFYQFNFEVFNSTQEYSKFMQSTIDLMTIVGKVLDVQIKEIKGSVNSESAINEMRSIVYTFLDKFQKENIGGVQFIKP